MSGRRRLLRVVLFAAAAAACIAAALELREQRAKVEQTVEAIEDQLNTLDPVTRAAVVARLGADATQEIKSRVRRHSD
jgi:organic hydroperoxide reductase OsmC/OhrA